MQKSMPMKGGTVKPGGGVSTHAVAGTTKTPKKPAPCNHKASMVMGPFGGKAPA